MTSNNINNAIEWTQYTGETIIVKIIIRGGKKVQETKFVEDRVNAKPNGNAYIIGNGPSRANFDLNTLQSSGQTYGCNALYRDFIPDYLFMVDRTVAQHINDNKIYEKTICYAPAIEYTRSNGNLHLIPNNPHWVSGSTAMWTACVHGHKNVYLIGFDFQEYGKGKLNNMYQDTELYGPRNNEGVMEVWLKQLRECVKQRPDVHFTVVHDAPTEAMKHLQRGTGLGYTSLMTYAEFKTKVLNPVG